MHPFRRTALGVLPLAAALMADSCIDGRTAAYAATLREPPSVTVSLKDLDLRTPAGTATAYLRIRNAARSVCGIADVFPGEKAAWDRCVQEAIGSAVARLRVARLTDYYLARTQQVDRTRREISTGSELAVH